jgi:hypothetical protein
MILRALEVKKATSAKKRKSEDPDKEDPVKKEIKASMSGQSSQLSCKQSWQLGSTTKSNFVSMQFKMMLLLAGAVK